MQKADAPAETLIIEDDEPPSGRLVLKSFYPSPVADFGPVPGKRHTFLVPVKTRPIKGLAKTTPKTRTFIKKFFPQASTRDWHDWQWQVRNRVRTYEKLNQILPLCPEEFLADKSSRLPLGITPYYLSLFSDSTPGNPLRRSVVPTVNEWIKMPCESDDPLGEDHQSPVPGLVHRYPDRVLFLLLDFCSTYCRYCTRSRVVGHGGILASRARWENAIEYIRNTPTIRDVLLSGGDPLTLSNDRLEWVLSRLRQIPHVQIIRIGTKVPAVLPQRITSALVKMLSSPIRMNVHLKPTKPAPCWRTPVFP